MWKRAGSHMIWHALDWRPRWYQSNEHRLLMSKHAKAAMNSWLGKEKASHNKQLKKSYRYRCRWRQLYTLNSTTTCGTILHPLQGTRDGNYATASKLTDYAGWHHFRHNKRPRISLTYPQLEGIVRVRILMVYPDVCRCLSLVVHKEGRGTVVRQGPSAGTGAIMLGLGAFSWPQGRLPRGGTSRSTIGHVVLHFRPWLTLMQPDSHLLQILRPKLDRDGAIKFHTCLIAVKHKPGYNTRLHSDAGFTGTGYVENSRSSGLNIYIGRTLQTDTHLQKLAVKNWCYQA